MTARRDYNLKIDIENLRIQIGSLSAGGGGGGMSAADSTWVASTFFQHSTWISSLFSIIPAPYDDAVLQAKVTSLYADVATLYARDDILATWVSSVYGVANGAVGSLENVRAVHSTWISSLNGRIGGEIDTRSTQIAALTSSWSATQNVHSTWINSAFGTYANLRDATSAWVQSLNLNLVAEIAVRSTDVAALTSSYQATKNVHSTWIDSIAAAVSSVTVGVSSVIPSQGDGTLAVRHAFYVTLSSTFTVAGGGAARIIPWNAVTWQGGIDSMDINSTYISPATGFVEFIAKTVFVNTGNPGTDCGMFIRKVNPNMVAARVSHINVRTNELVDLTCVWADKALAADEYRVEITATNTVRLRVDSANSYFTGILYR